MSKDIFQSNGLTVTSFCGPMDTSERTRMRLQFTVPSHTSIMRAAFDSLGFSEARVLSIALDRWLVENRDD